MPKIFICYRRDDSAYPAHRIYEELTNRFGRESVVFDIDTIPLGIDFHKYLNDQVGQCDILLAVMGDQWLETLRKRFDDPQDFVRIEIQIALERNIPVVPILVGKASVPGVEKLPQQLAGLAYRHAAEVRAGPDLQNHLKRLTNGLEYLLTEQAQKREEEMIPEPVSPEKVTTNSIGMKFILIPAGKFEMGSKLSPEEVAQQYGSEADIFTYRYENPQHSVDITKPFYIQTKEVTQGQWKKVMGENENPSHFNDCGDDCPVEEVSWEDAHEFIKQLNKMEDKDTKYRLPTEAEWEYACRAGSTTEFSFGDDPKVLGKYAWYDSNSANQTHPVGKKKPNTWGLYDMHGNVWEWVEDDWHDNYNSAPNDGRAWNDKSKGAGRVIRGGGWSSRARYCRSAIRSVNSLGDRYYALGFRLARSVALGP